MSEIDRTQAPIPVPHGLLTAVWEPLRDSVYEREIAEGAVCDTLQWLKAHGMLDGHEQLEGCRIAAENYAEGIKYGESIPSGFGDAFKAVLTCRQALDDEIAEASK